MRHLLTAYLALSLIAGTVALFVLLLANRRLRNRVLTYYIVACACLLTQVLHNLLLFYLGINISDQITRGTALLIVSSIPTSYAMQLCIPLMAHRLYGVSWEKTGNIIAMAAIGLQLAVLVSPWGMRYSAETRQISLGEGYFIQSALFIAFLAYALAIGVFLRKRLADRLRKIMRTFLVLLVLAMPGFIHDQLYFVSRTSVDAFPVVVIYFPLFFLALSVANIVYGLQFLATPTPPVPAVSEPDSSPSADMRLATLAGEFSLSDREKEVASLVVAGLGNKQIAASLSISVKTVSNHIYNLYQKLGINSRFELMALLSEKKPE